MPKIPGRLTFSTSFFLDNALAVLTVISIVLSLFNFWHLLPNLAPNNSKQLSTRNTEPIRWINVLPQAPSTQPPQESAPTFDQISTLKQGLQIKLVSVPDNQIEGFSKLLTQNKIDPPVKIGSNIYQIKSLTGDQENLDKLIEGAKIISSSDDQLFLLQDESSTAKKTPITILEDLSSQSTPVPNQDNLVIVPSIGPVREITDAEELAKFNTLPKDQFIGSQWHIGDPKLTTKPAPGVDKKPIIVAIIDGGVDISHPDLVNTIAKNSTGQVLGWNYWDNTPVQLTDISSKLDEAYGHGTHIAGIIGAETNEIGVTGSCLGTCQIMPLKVFGGVNSSGRISSAVRAIDYAVTNGAAVINLSWGSRNFNPILAQSIAAAQSKGVTFVAASGNNAEDNILYPAKLAGVISVGSLDRQGNKSKTTNFGGGITQYAPGVDILATSIPSSNTCTTDNKNFDNGVYNYCSGTSMAAAVASGKLAKEMAEKE